MSTELKTALFRRSNIPWLTTPAIAAALILIWELYVVATGVSAFILPAPGAVWRSWTALVTSPRAWMHTWITIQETLLGFFFGAVIGIALGILIGRVRWVELTLNPFIIATQVVPKVAFVPIFVVWFGFGPTSKVIVAAVLAFFPILSNAVLGVKSVEAGHRDVMVSMNATRWQTFWRLELPSAMPLIVTGMEVGIVLALIGAIVGEYLGGNTGLGFLMISRMNAYETEGLFAVMLQMSLLGFAFYFSIGFFRQIFVGWHQSAK
jgi:NitT/TauT family transport system permease protein